MLCDYINLGTGTSCSGPLASPDSYPWQYIEAAYIYPRYGSSLPTSSSRFEYCEEYCNNNDNCLGFLTDPGNPDYTGELTMVRCWITELEPTYVYYDGFSKVESCQKKIVESCRAAPTPNPTAPPRTPAPTDTIQDCQSCLNEDCTWCEAMSSIYNSECECRSPSRCTFGETEKMTSCGNANTSSIKNFFANAPTFVWPIFSICLFVIMLSIMCSCRRQMLAKNANAEAASTTTTTNAHSTTSPDNAHDDTNAPSSQTTNPHEQQNTNPFLNFGFSSIFDNAFATGNNGGGNHTTCTSTDYGGSGFTSSSNDYGGGGFTSSSTDYEWQWHSLLQAMIVAVAALLLPISKVRTFTSYF